MNIARLNLRTSLKNKSVKYLKIKDSNTFATNTFIAVKSIARQVYSGKQFNNKKIYYSNKNLGIE